MQMYFYMGFLPSASCLDQNDKLFFLQHILGIKPGKQKYKQIVILQNYRNIEFTLVLWLILASVIKQHIQELQNMSWSHF